MWILKLIEDENGYPSTMRVCTLLIVVFGFLHAFIYPEYSMYSLTLVGLTIGAKAGQSYIENNHRR